ncbi:hypothetical protein IJJ08_04405, partial [bacterium]|nr:hypothetical protein [bacterium]
MRYYRFKLGGGNNFLSLEDCPNLIASSLLLALLALTSSFWSVQPAMAAATGTKTMRLEDMPNGRVFNLGMYSFVKTADNEYMQTSNFTCPDGKYIAGKYVKCYEDETASECSSKDVDCSNGTISAVRSELEDGYTYTYQCNCKLGYQYHSDTHSCVFNECTGSQRYSDNEKACVAPQVTASEDICPSATGFLQEFTQEQCQALTPTTVSTIGQTACLMDERDGKIYAVRRYTSEISGNSYSQCWFAQNLAFGNCNNTNFPTSVQSSGTTGIVGTYGEHAYQGYCRASIGSAYDGYLYNWEAAMNNATARYYSTDTSATDTVYQAHTYAGDDASYQQRLATHDICPLGWHVPTGNGGEWGALNTAVGASVPFFRVAESGNTSSTNVSYVPAPWNATNKSSIAGHGYGTTLVYQGSNSYWWSSTVSSATNARGMNVDSSATDPAGSGSYKYHGFSVRCLLGN